MNPPSRRPVDVGLESLVAQPTLLLHKRVGLVCNQASVTGELVHCIDALRESGCDLRLVFAPEHGIHGDVQAQDQVNESHQTHASRKVRSLYGPHLSPDAQSLDAIDALVFDLQDVGARYYTYVWTMLLSMRACAKARIAMIVLDRPNPIGGVALEGNLLDPRFASFVGMHAIPARHGMTVAELAMLFNSQLDIGCDLRPIKMQGWQRDMFFDQTGLPWVLPSPNMPTLDTAIVYPGMCLLEGTNISEGRGTTKPFELFGATFIDASALLQRLDAMSLTGVRFRACSFRPTFDKFAGQLCHGAQIHVLNRHTFKPYLTGLAVIATIRELSPTAFAWRKPPYEFETRRLPFDMLTGTDSIRLAIEAGAAPQEIEAGWQAELDGFRQVRREFLLY